MRARHTPAGDGCPICRRRAHAGTLPGGSNCQQQLSLGTSPQYLAVESCLCWRSSSLIICDKGELARLQVVGETRPPLELSRPRQPFSRGGELTRPLADGESSPALCRWRELRPVSQGRARRPVCQWRELARPLWESSPTICCRANLSNPLSLGKARPPFVAGREFASFFVAGKSPLRLLPPRKARSAFAAKESSLRFFVAGETPPPFVDGRSSTGHSPLERAPRPGG